MSKICEIESPSNPVIKAAAKLRHRRGRKQQQRIIVDGYREVDCARRSGVQLEAVFFPATAAVNRDELRSWSVDLFALSDKAFAKLAFGNRCELVATAAMPQPELHEVPLSGNPLVAVLEHVEKPGNIGAVLRSADAAGVECVILIEPVTDLFNPNAIRASLGTIFALPVVATSWDAYLLWAREQHLVHYLARCEQAANYTAADFRGPCAVVLGSEAAGLTSRWHQVQHASAISIPMCGLADSLNVANAASVLFYEALRQRTANRNE